MSYFTFIFYLSKPLMAILSDKHINKIILIQGAHNCICSGAITRNNKQAAMHLRCVTAYIVLPPALCYHLHAVTWSSPVETPNIVYARTFVWTLNKRVSSERTLHRLRHVFMLFFYRFYVQVFLFEIFFSLNLDCLFAWNINVKCSTPWYIVLSHVQSIKDSNDV